MLVGEGLVGDMGLSVRWRAFSELAPFELYGALGLRQAVFVVEQNCAFLDADGFDTDAVHGLGRDGGGKLVAVARILPPGSKYQVPSIGRVAVATHVRRYGYGRAIMAAAMAEVERLYPRSPVKIDAQAIWRNSTPRSASFVQVSRSTRTVSCTSR